MRVKVRIKFTKVRRRWAKAYIRCQRYQDKDGFIYCKDCCNQGRFKWCPNVEDAHMEFCEEFCVVPTVFLV